MAPQLLRCREWPMFERDLINIKARLEGPRLAPWTGPEQEE
jgi:hypothetical protein